MSKHITDTAGDQLIIRTATDDDAAQFVEFYRYYVEHTSINFEYEPPDEAEFRRRIHEILPTFPWLVAVANESDSSDHILGYLFAEPVSSRGAYAWSVKSSIYLDRQARGRGVGTALYRELERILVAQHIVNLYSIITVTQDDALTDISKSSERKVWTNNGLKQASKATTTSHKVNEDPHLPATSPRFHHHLGFTVIGREIGSGYKFDTWYDKLLMQKKLAAPADPVRQPIAFNDLALYDEYR